MLQKLQVPLFLKFHSDYIGDLHVFQELPLFLRYSYV